MKSLRQLRSLRPALEYDKLSDGEEWREKEADIARRKRNAIEEKSSLHVVGFSPATILLQILSYASFSLLSYLLLDG